MTNKLNYKPDDRFRKFLAMSVCGERAAIRLMAHHGHEFEFSDFGAGSTEVSKDASKKRNRKADLKCRKCGQKLEVRAKSRPQLAMSDSMSRPFDSELAADDWVGFVQVNRASGLTQFDEHDPDHYQQVGHILVFTVAELSSRRAQLAEAKRKTESEGSEAYLEWPVLVATSNTVVTELRRDPEGSSILFENGRQVAVTTGWFPYSGLKKGSAVTAGQTILCGLAKPLVRAELMCKNL